VTPFGSPSSLFKPTQSFDALLKGRGFWKRGGGKQEFLRREKWFAQEEEREGQVKRIRQLKQYVKDDE
jgi:hypothetical protein